MWWRPPAPYLIEQFVAPGIALPDGRLVFTMWGSAVCGDNWQCGVLLSDDGRHTLRHRHVGYEPDPAIRKDPEVMAGYNERTLFAATDGTLVSVIRGRDQVDPFPLDEALDGGHEVLRHGRQQRRGRHRVTAQRAQVVGGAASALQERHVGVQVHTVDALQFKGDVIGQNLGGGSCYVHVGVGSRTGAPTVGSGGKSNRFRVGPQSGSHGHVSSPRLIKRSMRFSRTTLSCPLLVKGYVAYRVGCALEAASRHRTR